MTSLAEREQDVALQFTPFEGGGLDDLQRARKRVLPVLDEGEKQTQGGMDSAIPPINQTHLKGLEKRRALHNDNLLLGEARLLDAAGIKLCCPLETPNSPTFALRPVTRSTSQRFRN